MPSLSRYATFLAAGLSTACSGAASPAVGARPPVTSPAAATAPAIQIRDCVDVGSELGHNLSGLAWDGGQLIAISDRSRQLVRLPPSAQPIAPTAYLKLDTPGKWDGEAIAIAGDQLVVIADEVEPVAWFVERATGKLVSHVDLPTFHGVRTNLGLESLGFFAAHGARYLFAANEQALEDDGPCATNDHGTVIRILRHPLDGGEDIEIAYRTERVTALEGATYTANCARDTDANNGVSELTPLDEDHLLILERGWVKGFGNSVRIFKVDLRGAKNVHGKPITEAAIVPKVEVLDLAKLPERCPARKPGAIQPNNNFENYEGMALGPPRADGTRLLYLLADDNDKPDHHTQSARLLTLELPRGTL